MTHAIPNTAPGADGGMMGLAGLLRVWRAQAGRKLGRDKPISQQEVAEDSGLSPRWYGELERGAQPRLQRETVERLADVLMLGEGERRALFLYTLGSVPEHPEAPMPTGLADRYLQMLLDQQMPRPAYLTDTSWNVVGYNATMADWFPWVLKPGANLMRWGLLDPEAREQLVGWRGHARTYLAMIRVALAGRPNDPDLTQLLSDVLQDPAVKELWGEEPTLVAYRDGDRFRLHIRRFDYQDLDVISHVFLPASYRDLRFVVITWLGSEDDPAVPDELRPVDQLPTAPSVPADATAGSCKPYLNVRSRADVEHLAGDDRTPLPALARMLGPGRCLYLDPGIPGQMSPTVVLGTAQSNGSWDVDMLEVGEALRMRRLCPSDPTSPAAAEFRLILRAELPDSRTEAAGALAVLADCAQARLAMYASLLTELEGEAQAA